MFIVRRYREERRKGKDLESALLTTLDTAGRTVAFSSLTVAVAVMAMLVFPLYFLRSFAFAGVSVVLLAAATESQGGPCQGREGLFPTPAPRRQAAVVAALMATWSG